MTRFFTSSRFSACFGSLLAFPCTRVVNPVARKLASRAMKRSFPIKCAIILTRHVHVFCVCAHAFVCVCMCKFLWAICRLREGGGSSSSRPVMNRGQLPTNQLRNNWGALDHASCAPQLMSCNYYVCVHVCVCVCVCVCMYCVCVHACVCMCTCVCVHRVCVHTCMYMFVGSCLATSVYGQFAGYRKGVGHLQFLS